MGYYDAPSDEVFKEIQDAAIKIWNTYDNTHGYAGTKIAHVKSITNFKDNWGTIIGMFDHNNQKKLLALLSPEAKEKVREWL